MKKIILLFSLFIALFGLSFKASAFELVDDVDSLTVLSGTKEIILDYDESYEIIYSKNNIGLVRENNKVKLLNLTNSSSNIFIYKDGVEVRTISLSFVSPDKLQIIKEGDLYYAGDNGKKIYGDFTWVAADKEFIGVSASADPFTKLKYNGELIPYVSFKPEFLDDVWILALGLPLLIIVLAYIIYLLLPFNVYKRINRNALRLKNNLIKAKSKYTNKEIVNAYVLLKGKVTTITNYIKMVPEECPIHKDLNKIKSDLLLAVENLNRLGRNFPSKSLDSLLDYFIFKMDNLMDLLENGSFNFKSNNKNEAKKKISIPENRELNKEEIDAYHYLEGINVIKK